jgi:hypothetical protein
MDTVNLVTDPNDGRAIWCGTLQHVAQVRDGAFGGRVLVASARDELAQLDWKPNRGGVRMPNTPEDDWRIL